MLDGENYEGVAGTLGVDAGEVRERAHGGLEALKSDPARDLPLAEVQRRLRVLDDPDSAPAAAAEARHENRRRSLLTWIGLGAALIAIVVVLIVVLGGGGSGSGGTSSRGQGSEEAVRIEMQPVGRSHAGGTVTLVRVADQPALRLELHGLEPSGPDRSYVLWFVGQGNRSLPVAFHAVGADGRLGGAVAVPSASIGLLPDFTTALLTLTDQQEAARAVRQSAQSGILPQPVGTTVMRGALR